MIRSNWCRILVATVIACGSFGVITPGSAHTLGVDRADLIERDDGTYRLISRVPQNLAHLITAPELPQRCSLQGNPRGERGSYEVRFDFVCDKPLTAGDVLHLPWKREGVMLTAIWNSDDTITRLVSRQGAVISVQLDQFKAGSGSRAQAAKRYTALGIVHILSGIDHLLFVLGLLLLVRGPWMLVKTVTAFTLAHSITLALATLGIVNLPPRPVEAAIALSIVFLAVEIIRGYQRRVHLTHRQPWLVAFAFGLLHGLGFAGALSELGLPQSEIPIALLFFNIGVEIGQLIFVALVLCAIRLWRRTGVGWPRRLAYVPAYAIGTIATYWFLERASGIFVSV